MTKFDSKIVVEEWLLDFAIKVGGANHSHATQDLYDSIAAGNYPEGKHFIQTIDPDHEDKFDFDPLDVTKTWSEDIPPLLPVVLSVLNKNIDNFFAENEQLSTQIVFMVVLIMMFLVGTTTLWSSIPQLRTCGGKLIVFSFAATSFPVPRELPIVIIYHMCMLFANHILMDRKQMFCIKSSHIKLTDFYYKQDNWSTVKDILNEESYVQPINSPVIVCGDIQGQSHDLMKLFQTGDMYLTQITFSCSSMVKQTHWHK